MDHIDAYLCWVRLNRALRHPVGRDVQALDADGRVPAANVNAVRARIPSVRLSRDGETAPVPGSCAGSSRAGALATK